jgi:hypothetical protein
VRLAKRIGPDGLVAGLSVGQVVAAIKAEMAALDVEGKFVRIEIEAAPEPGTSTPLSNSTGLGCAKLPQRQSEHSSAGEKPVGLWPPPELASAAVTGAAAKLGQSLTSKPNEKPSFEGLKLFIGWIIMSAIAFTFLFQWLWPLLYPLLRNNILAKQIGKRREHWLALVATVASILTGDEWQPDKSEAGAASIPDGPDRHHHGTARTDF